MLAGLAFISASAAATSRWRRRQAGFRASAHRPAARSGGVPSDVRWLPGEETAERAGDGGGSFFGEEVPAADRGAGHVGGEFAPQRERSAIVVIPGRQRSGRAPQDEYWAGDAAARCAVGGIVVAVNARGGAVFLADG